MNPWVRRSLMAVAILMFLVAAAAGVLVWHGHGLAMRKVSLPESVAQRAPAFVDTPQAKVRGAHLYASRGCADCHGANGAGRTFVDDGKGMRMAGPAIHTGPGSVTLGYTARDWHLTVRHGVKPDGRPLMVMPSEEYNRLTDEDFAALVAHVRGLPPAGGGAAVLDLPPPVWALYGAGYIRDAATKIDHALPSAAVVPYGPTAAYGAYIANGCTGCHGAQLEGGRVRGGPPDWPPAARLSRGDGGVMSRYATLESFTAMLRTGKRPDGSAVKVMPFEALSQFDDTEVRALHAYLLTR